MKCLRIVPSRRRLSSRSHVQKIVRFVWPRFSLGKTFFQQAWLLNNRFLPTRNKKVNTTHCSPPDFFQHGNWGVWKPLVKFTYGRTQGIPPGVPQGDPPRRPPGGSPQGTPGGIPPALSRFSTRGIFGSHPNQMFERSPPLNNVPNGVGYLMYQARFGTFDGLWTPPDGVPPRLWYISSPHTIPPST